MTNVKRGELVEFTDGYHRDYTMGDPRFARYGVAVEDATSERSVRVMLADRSVVTAKHVMAYAWGGWMPEDLEPVYAELNPEPDPWSDYD